ncbi:hypothetical protein Hanom_Chr14g01322761 [Helianthus anomalus]
MRLVSEESLMENVPFISTSSYTYTIIHITLPYESASFPPCLTNCPRTRGLCSASFFRL